MALVATSHSGETDSTSDTSWDETYGVEFASASSWGVFICAVDNAETNGVAHTTFTMTDSLGNTWTRRISPLFDNGTASQGVEGAIFTTPQNGGRITAAATFTVAFGVNTPVKVGMLYEITSAGTISYVTGGVNTGATTTTPTVTTGTITSGDMVIGGLFNEQGTTQVVTHDSDTSNGSWTQNGVQSSGSLAAGMTVSVQTKVVTGTATQTFNPTLGTSSDVILGYIVLNEAGGGNVTVTPTTLALVLVTFAPTVTVTGNVTATPDLAALILTTFAPTVTVSSGNVTVTPTTATLNLSAFAPTVTATGGAFVQGVGGFMIIG